MPSQAISPSGEKPKKQQVAALVPADVAEFIAADAEAGGGQSEASVVRGILIRHYAKRRRQVTKLRRAA